MVPLGYGTRTGGPTWAGLQLGLCVCVCVFDAVHSCFTLTSKNQTAPVMGHPSVLSLCSGFQLCHLGS